MREIELENDKIKQENSYLVQRTDKDLAKLRQYISECERNLELQSRNE